MLHFALLYTIAVVFGARVAQLGPVIEIDSGKVRGLIDDGVWTHRSIPYAAPPIGNLRLKPPQPVESWKQTLLCSTEGNICPQFHFSNNVKSHTYVGNEDCLTLDVYAPESLASNQTNLLPVVVWIYGGGYSLGDKTELGAYDASNLVRERPYVHVAMNYRLGPLGFLALDELKNETSDATTGNYALQDQQFALQWVQRNIKNFGGDPNRVAIWGESAGAFSVCWHMVSPLSRSLFHAAIAESGTCDSPQFFVEYGAMRSFSRSLINHAGCGTNDKRNDEAYLECIRSLPTAALMTKFIDFDPTTFLPNSYHPSLYPVMPFGPAIDGSKAGLLDVPINLISSGNYNQVPYILGTNLDEGTIFVPIMREVIDNITLPLTKEGFNTALLYFFVGNQSIVDSVNQQYQIADYKSYDDMVAKILRDYFFVCATRRTARAMSRFVPDVYMYQFTFPVHEGIGKRLGDNHGSELLYVFNTLRSTLSAEQSQMVFTFGQMWSNFLHQDTHNPNFPLSTNDGSGIVWPQYSVASGEQNLEMDVPVRLNARLLGDKCDYWDTVGLNEYLRSVKYSS